MKEGKRYRNVETEEQRKHKLEEVDKDFFSLRSLIPEITGIEESNSSFDAVYRDVQRLVRVMQLTSDGESGKFRIPRKLKKQFVLLTKSFYEKREYRDIISRIRREEQITDDDYYKIIAEFIKIEEQSLDEEFRLGVRYLKESLELDEFYELADKIVSNVKTNIMTINSIFDHGKKIELLKMYSTNIEESFSDVRDDIAQYEKLLSMVMKRLEDNGMKDRILRKDDNIKNGKVQIEEMIIDMLIKNNEL